MPYPSFVGAGTLSGDGGAFITLDYPTGIAIGHYLFAVICDADNDRFMPPGTNWKQLRVDYHNNLSYTICGKYVDGTEDLTNGLLVGSEEVSGNLIWGCMYAFKDVRGLDDSFNIGVPYDKTQTSNVKSDTSTSMAISSGAAGDRRLMVAFMIQEDNTTFILQGGTWSEEDNQNTSVGSDGAIAVATLQADNNGGTAVVEYQTPGNEYSAGFQLALVGKSETTVTLNTADKTEFPDDTTPTLEFTPDSSGSEEHFVEIQIDTTPDFKSCDALNANNNPQDSQLNASSSITEVGFSFQGKKEVITEASFVLSKAGTPTGRILIELYNHTGTYGSTGQPSSKIATIGYLDAEFLTDSFVRYAIKFTYPYKLKKNLNYFIVLVHSGDASNYIRYAYSNAGVHTDGNSATKAGSWDYETYDFLFSISTYRETLVSKHSDVYPKRDYYMNAISGLNNTTSGGFSQSFLSTNTFTPYSVTVPISKTGNPIGSLIAKIMSASSGVPGTSTYVTSHPLSFEDFGPGQATLFFPNLTRTVPSNQECALVVEYLSDGNMDVDNYIGRGVDSHVLGNHPGVMYSKDSLNGSWNAEDTSWNFPFRLRINRLNIMRPMISAYSHYNDGFLNTVSGGDMHPFNDNEKLSYTVPESVYNGKKYFYVDGNGGVVDTNNAWDNDANAYDGSETTYANTNATFESTPNVLQITGVNSPTTSRDFYIRQIKVRVLYAFSDSTTPRWTSKHVLRKNNNVNDHFRDFNWDELQDFITKINVTRSGSDSIVTIECDHANYSGNVNSHFVAGVSGQLRVYKIEYEVSSGGDVIEEEYYADGSAGSTLDNDSAWIDEANIIAGDSNAGYTSTVGTETTNELRIFGTNAPTRTTNISDVLLQVDIATSGIEDYRLNEPIGGWTWDILQNLEFVLWKWTIEGNTAKECYVYTASGEFLGGWYYRNAGQVDFSLRQINLKVLSSTILREDIPYFWRARASNDTPDLADAWSEWSETRSFTIIADDSNVNFDATVLNVDLAIVEPVVTTQVNFVATVLSAAFAIVEPVVGLGADFTATVLNADFAIVEPVVTLGSNFVATELPVNFAIVEPVITTQVNFTASVLDAVFAIVEPVVNINAGFTATVLNANFGIVEPVITTEQIITAPLLSAEFAIVEPVVNINAGFTATVLNATFAIIEPEVITAVDVDFVATVINLDFAIVEPVVNINAGFTASVLNADFAIVEPTITEGVGVTFVATVIDISFAIVEPVVNISSDFVTTVLNADFAIVEPVVTTEQIITASLLNSTFAIVEPVVTGESNFTASVISVNFAIIEPTVNIDAGFTASVLNVVFAIQEPTVSGNAGFVATVLNALFAIVEPTVTTEQNIVVTALNALFEIQSPTIEAGGTVDFGATVINISLAIIEPTVSTEVNHTASALNVAFNIPEPVVNIDSDFVASLLNANFAILEPTITTQQNIIATALNVNFAILEPTITADSNVTISVVNILIGIIEPVINISVNTQVSFVNAVFNIIEPVVTTEGGVEIIADLLDVSLAIEEPSIIGDANVTADVVSGVWEILEPSVEVDVDIAAPMQVVTMEIIDPVVTAIYWTPTETIDKISAITTTKNLDSTITSIINLKSILDGENI